ncbi:hypothetical protein MKX01_013041 [Papaver californicum]|nr:hypothetical protein MKX01_013041 [Papaver californicum]
MNSFLCCSSVEDQIILSLKIHWSQFEDLLGCWKFSNLSVPAIIVGPTIELDDGKLLLCGTRLPTLKNGSPSYTCGLVTQKLSGTTKDCAKRAITIFIHVEKRLDALILYASEIFLYLEEKLKLTLQTTSDEVTPADWLEKMHQVLLSIDPKHLMIEL